MARKMTALVIVRYEKCKFPWFLSDNSAFLGGLGVLAVNSIRLFT